MMKTSSVILNGELDVEIVDVGKPDEINEVRAHQLT
jgi:hypothetical protein